MFKRSKDINVLEVLCFDGSLDKVLSIELIGNVEVFRSSILKS